MIVKEELVDHVCEVKRRAGGVGVLEELWLGLS